MNTHTQSELEISRTFRTLTLAAAVLILQVIGIGTVSAQGRLSGPVDPELPGTACTATVLPHFPLQAGNQWSYTKQGLGGVEAWQVNVIQKSETGTTELQGYFGATHTVCSGTGGTVHEVSADTGEVMWYDLGGAVGSVWRIHLDPNDRDMPECVDGSKISIASRAEHVVVPAGSFDNVIRVDYISPCADAGILSEWFAPGVGLIKRTEQSFSGPRVSELQSAIVGGFILPRPALSSTLLLDKQPVSSQGSSSDASLMLRANFILSNDGAVASEFDFDGCASMTVSVIDKDGKPRASARANDGGDCKSGRTVHVAIANGALALPISFRLQGMTGEALEEGRYLIVATLDTLDPAPLRPSASATIDITSPSDK